MTDPDLFCPFEEDYCPDEILLKIVKLSAINEVGKYDQDFLFHTIGRVSKRFNKMAHDASFWKSGRLI